MKALKNFQEDFKAKTRQYAKRQNIWFRKEEDFLWIDVMGGSTIKRLNDVVNRVIGCVAMDRNKLKEMLKTDEQAKLRAVNGDPENAKELKEYKPEGRIMTDTNLQ